MVKRYDPKTIEPKWQQVWQQSGLYKTTQDPKRSNFYNLTMFPYPSGDLHTGHWFAFTAPDIMARWRRMRGLNVLYPIGYDSFGLPAENAAIKRNIPPATWTNQNIEDMTHQFETMGPAYDWDKVLRTSDPDYYKWTQWIFLKLFEKGLAERRKSLVNWCPKDQTVLANEQTIGEDGTKNVCVRCGTPIVQKELEQWYFKITDYAEELLTELDNLDWPERVKVMQQNWIGKSVGAEVDFKIDGDKNSIRIFTTRPDTLFGATYMVLAPEHPLVEKITTDDQKGALDDYVAKTRGKTELDRKEGEKTKTGVATGAYAINPVNNEKIPIWIADYVLMSYGTGAIMAVPAHDQRDFEFAKQYDLAVVNVINPVTGEKQDDPTPKPKIAAVVVNDKGEILTNRWRPELGGRLLIGGTIDEGETPLETATREITEETGYTDFELIEQGDETVIHEYYAFSKKQATRALATVLYFRLKSDQRVKTSHQADEKNMFVVEWVTPAVAEREIHDDLHQYAIAKFIHGRVHEGEGVMTNSGSYDGLRSEVMREQIVADLVKKGVAKEQINYRLRDWLISRQRYWGAPIPIVYCDKCGIQPIPVDQLPVLLPEDVEFEPTGQSPLLKIDEFVQTTCPNCGGPAKRETDTMDTFVDSSWYFLRYPNTEYEQGPFDPAAVKQWLPVDHYMGGIEHAILHLLYARFITKALADHAGLGFREPFVKLSNQGIVLGPDAQKMSKSRGNVVNPDEQVGAYGADTFRTFLMFIGPWDQGGPFNVSGIAGVRRFLERVWTLSQTFIDHKPGTADSTQSGALLARVMHKATRTVTSDLEDLSFNTAIASLMEAVNELYKLKHDIPLSDPEWGRALETLLKLLAPFAPHLSEELWQQLGHKDSIHIEAWPIWDESLVRDELVTIVVQINGKVRDQLVLPSDADEKTVIAKAKSQPKVKTYLKGHEPTRTIYVAGKLINFVIS